MKIGYGIAVDDPYISIAKGVLNGVAEVAIPGSFLVDLFPILKYVPSWFPGAGFQKKAARWRKDIHIMADKPFRHVQKQFVQVFFLCFFEQLLIVFYREMAKLRPPWQQASLSVFLTKAILNGPGKKGLQKMYFLQYMQVREVPSMLDVPLTLSLPLVRS